MGTLIRRLVAGIERARDAVAAHDGRTGFAAGGRIAHLCAVAVLAIAAGGIVAGMDALVRRLVAGVGRARDAVAAVARGASTHAGRTGIAGRAVLAVIASGPFATGVWLQPLIGSQVSVVHELPSSHGASVPSVQNP